MRTRRPVTPRAAAIAQPQDRRTARVTLLTQQDCNLCDQAKAVLADLQQDPSLPVHLEVVEVTLDTDQGHELATAAGVLFAPGVLLDGQPFSHGRLSQRKLRKALEASKAHHEQSSP